MDRGDGGSGRDKREKRREETNEAAASPSANVVPTLHATRSSRSGSTTMHLQGYQYTKAYASQRKIAYRCSQYRRTGCKGKVDFSFSAKGYVNFHPHICQDDHVVVSTTTVNVEKEMKRAVDTLAISDTSLTAHAVWDAIDAQFYASRRGDDVVTQGLTRQQVISRVYRTRKLHFSGGETSGAGAAGSGAGAGAVATTTTTSMLGQLEMPPLSRVKDQPQLHFFQFQLSRSVNWKQTPERVIGWAHPVLIYLLKYHGTTLFIDTTFRRSVPRSFKQCLVLMVHDRGSGLHVPVFYVLCTSRTADLYRNVLHLIAQATDKAIDPAEIVCDFECGLHTAAKAKFPSANVTGSLFFFKHAVRRRMKKLGITDLAASVAMESGVLDVLTVIDPAKIKAQGIAWVTREIKSRCGELKIEYQAENWKMFWKYFRRTYLGEVYPPGMWNVHGVSPDIVAKTNNPTEKFSKELQIAFPGGPSSRPDLQTFVTSIEEISRHYVKKLGDPTRHRRTSTSKRRESILNLPEPPALDGVLSDSDDGDDDDARDDDDGSDESDGISSDDDDEEENERAHDNSSEGEGSDRHFEA
ncbi:putative cleavage induced protein, partial [Globisporangium splendens]